MAPTEPTQTPESRLAVGDSAARRRLVVYVFAAIALCVVLWALIEGGERDLWTRPSALELSVPFASFAL